MDWELYERQRATLAFICLAFLSFLFLAFQRSAPVQYVKSLIVACTFPAQRQFSQWAAQRGQAPESEQRGQAPLASADAPAPMASEIIDTHAERSRALRVLMEENSRLSGILNLKRERWPRLVAAHVVSRDPQRWFQEILLDKGQDDGVRVDDPVVALAGSREALVGRVVETGARSARVLLIHDSLSAVAATVAGSTTDDGVVEGTNSHDLYLRYLPRDSQVKIGDLVVTAGLGKIFPEGIPIGWVQEIQLDKRQLFIEARLSPSMVSAPLRFVGILVKAER